VIQQVAWPEAAAYEASLLSAIEEHRGRYPSTKLNVGGQWSGPKMLFTDPSVADRTQPLATWLASQLDVDPYRGITGWGLVVGPGEAVAKHKHEKSSTFGRNRYAGTYCVTCPPLAPGSSALTVWEADGTTTARFAPVPGSAVLFGAMDQHAAAAHVEQTPRVMIGFSVP
jgi:hypothetical protein